MLNMFETYFSSKKSRLIEDFKGNRRKYLSLGLASILIFLAIVYLGPFNGLEKLGLIGKQKQEQSARAEAIRGVVGDGWADVVLGKPDFSNISPNEVVFSKLFNPHGIFIDRTSSPQKIYVWDSGNNRILGFNWDQMLSSPGNPIVPTTQTQKIVIGQPNFTSAGANRDSGLQNYPEFPSAGASTLCGLPPEAFSIGESGSGASMAVDTSGNLYVYDACNHRVLKYDRPFDTDTLADDVWGQDDFASHGQNKGAGPYAPTATSLSYCWGNTNSWTAGVEVDSSGNLWVADSCNNRVLRYPNGSHTPDLVLGKKEFDSFAYGPGLNQLQTPTALRFNSNGWLYVADAGNNRVLVFKPPFSSGMEGRVFGSGFLLPEGIDFDPTEPGRVWIANKGAATVELWDETTGTKIKELGRRGDNNNLGNVTGSIGIDKDGNVVVTGGTTALSGAVLFKKGQRTDIPTNQIFSIWGIDSSDGNLVSRSALGGQTTGVAVANNQMIVAGSGRLLYWNNPQNLTNGQPADGFADDGSGRLTSFTNFIGGWNSILSADKNGHLWAVLGEILKYDLPLGDTGGVEQPTKISKTLSVLGGGTITLGNILWGVVASDNSEFLWISDTTKNRVVRIRNPLDSNRVVDVILGQTDISGTFPNRYSGSNDSTEIRARATANTLYLPGALALDRSGNLFVSDHSLETQGNLRLLVFKKEDLPANNAQINLAPAAFKIFPNLTSWAPAFDSQNRMFVGFNAQLGGSIPSPKHRFIAVYNDPLGSSNTPDDYLKDFFSNPFSLTFDDSENLYATDLNRNRALIYKKPLNATAPSTNPSPTPAPSGSPSPSLLPSSSPSPTPTPSPGDTQMPAVSIANPTNGANVSGTVKITGVAADNIGVVKMEISVDNSTVASTDNVTTIFYSWNTKPKKVSTGAHNIRVSAYDAAGNVNSATITVNKTK